MKKLFAILLLIWGAQVSVFSQTADDIIDKHLDAIGGKEKLRKINTLIMEAKVVTPQFEFPMTFTKVHNKGFRMDLSVMGMDGWIIIRPDSGWMFMPFQGQTKPEAMPADQIKESIDQLDLSTVLCDYKEKGHTVEYLGMDDVEGTECHKLKVTTKTAKTIYYLIDPTSFYIVKQLSKEKAGGKEFDAEIKFSNYKEIEGGYRFPHNMESMNGPLEIVKVSINTPIDDSKFTAKI
jgi:hypothetical protein